MKCKITLNLILHIIIIICSPVEKSQPPGLQNPNELHDVQEADVENDNKNIN